MADRLLRDALADPDIFDLRLPATEQEIRDVEERLGIHLPPSFRRVLAQLGQGSFFDNETLLGVQEIDEGTGDLARVNEELWERQGMPRTLVVFHLGTGGLHAFDASGAGPELEVVALDEDTLEPLETFHDFDDWYVNGVRAEYRSVLGLDQ